MSPPTRALPSISSLLDLPAAIDAVGRHGRDRVVTLLRAAVDRARQRPDGPVPSPSELVEEVVGELDQAHAGRTRRVVNATGVVLHTNLGRAPLSAPAVDAMIDAAGYSTVEYDVRAGARGRHRGEHAHRLLTAATGADAACVVNNGAAALVLAITALAHGREVVVSRGELIEIGGSFRLPELMAGAGVVLREVGTTNRTHGRDYANAIGADTGAVLQVHPSNYRVVGFATRPDTAEIAATARDAGVPFIVDVGSGLLDDHDAALADEPIASATLDAGADLVVFSGDKLLGGPQAGVIAGRADLVERCRTHPLARALRIDKFRLAALEATVDQHLAGAVPPARVMLARALDDLERTAAELASAIDGRVVPVTSKAGGGSLPDLDLPSAAVAIDGPPDRVLASLRTWDPPIIGRIVEDRAVLDVRTLSEADLTVVAEAIPSLRRADWQHPDGDESPIAGDGTDPDRDGPTE